MTAPAENTAGPGDRRPVVCDPVLEPRVGVDGPAGPPGAVSDEELRAWPKVDLHVHLVGSAAPHTVADLAARHPEAGVPADLVGLQDFYAFSDFAHFIRVYTAVSGLLRTAADVEALVLGLGADLSAQGVLYAEVTVTPVAHLRAGVAADELAQALDRGAARVRRAHGVALAWVYDIAAGDGPAGADDTLRAALRHPPAGLVGFGLGGSEAGIHRSDFRDVFARARAAGLHSVPHAGETVGPEQVWAAVRDLGAERVGHGIAAHRDPRLMSHLREKGIALEVCPSSNVATGAVPGLAAHPLPTLLDNGVPVTLGSDDPPMFATSLLEEYRRVRDVLGLTRSQLRTLITTGIRVSFASDPIRRRLTAGVRSTSTGRSAARAR